jgi:hypothetical protein
VRLTAEGLGARQEYSELMRTVEKRWETRSGKDLLRPLRADLEALAGDATAKASPLFAGLEPHPEGWRTAVPRPATLPHFPMVLHRGGFPDGS